MIGRETFVSLGTRDTVEKRDIEEGIRALVALLPFGAGPGVEDACRKNLALYPRPERSQFKANAVAHSYGPVATKICDGRFGNVVFDEMLADGACSAPTFSHAPIGTGKVETLFPFRDMVVKLVYKAERVIYNVTLPKHVFFPGYVKLAVVENWTKTVVAVSARGSATGCSSTQSSGRRSSTQSSPSISCRKSGARSVAGPSGEAVAPAGRPSPAANEPPYAVPRGEGVALRGGGWKFGADGGTSIALISSVPPAEHLDGTLPVKANLDPAASSPCYDRYGNSSASGLAAVALVAMVAAVAGAFAAAILRCWPTVSGG